MSKFESQFNTAPVWQCRLFLSRQVLRGPEMGLGGPWGLGRGATHCLGGWRGGSLLVTKPELTLWNGSCCGASDVRRAQKPTRMGPVCAPLFFDERTGWLAVRLTWRLLAAAARPAAQKRKSRCSEHTHTPKFIKRSPGFSIFSFYFCRLLTHLVGFFMVSELACLVQEWVPIELFFQLLWTPTPKYSVLEI